MAIWRLSITYWLVFNGRLVARHVISLVTGITKQHSVLQPSKDTLYAYHQFVSYKHPKIHCMLIINSYHTTIQRYIVCLSSIRIIQPAKDTLYAYHQFVSYNQPKIHCMLIINSYHPNIQRHYACF